MPSASTAKLEKQASSEALDPIKQGIVFVDHKIRNLIKKKGRLDTYREIQKSGKELDADQKQSILKYDEVCQNLLFAQEVSKQLNTISVDSVKLQKKKEKKEAYEREQQETAKVKEILIIQDVLASMGSDTVREDFLAGRNKAVQLTEAELRYLDELFVEVSPKREPEENQPPFAEQAQNAAKHLLSIVEGKDKEIVGTKYSTLQELIEKINNCGYFDDPNAQEPIVQEAVEEAAPEEPQPVEPVEPELEELEPEPEPVPSATYQPSAASLEPVVPPVAETAGLYISQRPMADVLTNVMGASSATFNFIQTPQTGAGDWNDSTEQNNDWAVEVEQRDENRWNEPTQQSEDFNENDGFQTAGRGGGRGGPRRGGDRGRGGPRGDRGRGGGGYQNGRGNYGNNQNNRGGGGYYRNNNSEERGNYYQNGYQSRGDGERGSRDNREGGRGRGGPRGGGQDYRGGGQDYRGGGQDYRGGGQDNRGPRTDRGAPRGGRGGGGGGGNPRGGSRGNRQ